MNEPAIGEAISALELIAQDEQARRIYELREKARWDSVSARAAYLEEGIEQGLLKKATEVARNMLLLKIDTNVIQKVTGLSKEEISKLVH